MKFLLVRVIVGVDVVVVVVCSGVLCVDDEFYLLLLFVEDEDLEVIKLCVVLDYCIGEV